MSKAPPARAVVIHGHFYQPPREDPWLGQVPLQPGAAPFHDWNERVDAECYRPVVEARILDGDGGTRRVLNCLELMSFNFGPTLLSWLETHSRDTYEAVLSADAVARARTGHGAALAMAYHHPILPLATRRDKRTEIRWGIQDFKRRFGRHPEGMWLPETAADLETLEVLAGEGVEFTILAPHQVRGKPPRGRPGRIRTATGESLTVVPYRGDLSHAVAFGDALRDAEGWAELLVQVGGGGDLCLLSTDGETYGHHKKFGEMALAATLEKLDASVEVELTNLAAYLAEHPATEEVELVSPSSWSCAHGVGRWKEDCGCRLDLSADTSQAWRKPLRRAVSALAEQLHTVFESKAEGIFEDPWAARDAYGEVVGVDEPSRRRGWVEKRYPGSESEVDRAVQLLELERNALRIFTSCAWFFDDLAGVEQVQVLRYAARALELAESLGGSAEELRTVLLDALSTARSNESEPRSGRRFYLEDVVPSVPATAYVAARRVAGISAPPGPWAAQVDGDRSRVTVTHAATGEAVRFEVENPSDHETPASPGSPAGVELIDPEGRKFTVDPEAPWP